MGLRIISGGAGGGAAGVTSIAANGGVPRAGVLGIIGVAGVQIVDNGDGSFTFRSNLTFAGLGDVQLAALADGQVPVWVAAAGKWENQTRRVARNISDYSEDARQLVTAGAVPIVLLDRTIAAAPAGNYSLSAYFYQQNATSGRVNFLTSSGGGALADPQDDAIGTHNFAGWKPLLSAYNHAGGDLRVQIVAQDENGGAPGVTFGAGGDSRFGRRLVVTSS